MGKVYSYFLRPIRTFNIHNRVERVISKDKPTPAPQYPYVQKQKEIVDNLYPDFMESHMKKNTNLDNRLKQVFVTSKGETVQVSSNESSTRPLPRDKSAQPLFPHEIDEPNMIPEGKCSLKQATEFLSKYTKDPTEKCIEDIALTYKLDKKLVENIVKHFKVPDARMSPALKAKEDVRMKWELYKTK